MGEVTEGGVAAFGSPLEASANGDVQRREYDEGQLDYHRGQRSIYSLRKS